MKFCFRVLVGASGAVTGIILILTLVYFNRRELEGAGSEIIVTYHAYYQFPRHGGAGGRAAGATSLAATPLADSETRSEDAPSTSYASDDGRDKHPKVMLCSSLHNTLSYNSTVFRARPRDNSIHNCCTLLHSEGYRMCSLDTRDVHGLAPINVTPHPPPTPRR